MDVSKISMPMQAEPISAVRMYSNPPRSAPVETQAGQQTNQSISTEKLDAAMAALATHANLKVVMSRDDQTGRDVVRIFSEDGQRLLRQMPPEAVLKIAENLARGGSGTLLGALV